MPFAAGGAALDTIQTALEIDRQLSALEDPGARQWQRRGFGLYLSGLGRAHRRMGERPGMRGFVLVRYRHSTSQIGAAFVLSSSRVLTPCTSRDAPAQNNNSAPNRCPAMPSDLPYRPCVGIMLFNRRRQGVCRQAHRPDGGRLADAAGRHRQGRRAATGGDARTARKKSAPTRPRSSARWMTG